VKLCSSGFEQEVTEETEKEISAISVCSCLSFRVPR
jgi:hypothetical protein